MLLTAAMPKLGPHHPEADAQVAKQRKPCMGPMGVALLSLVLLLLRPRVLIMLVLLLLLYGSAADDGIAVCYCCPLPRLLSM